MLDATIMFDTTDTTDTIEAIGAIDATTWFEACAEHRGAVVDGPCEHCGWLAAEHTAGLAEVIAVPRTASAPRLRRAS